MIDPLLAAITASLGRLPQRSFKRLWDSGPPGLAYQASEHDKAGRREDALRVLDVAAELAPTDGRSRPNERAWSRAASTRRCRAWRSYVPR